MHHNNWKQNAIHFINWCSTQTRFNAKTAWNIFPFLLFRSCVVCEMVSALTVHSSLFRCVYMAPIFLLLFLFSISFRLFFPSAARFVLWSHNNNNNNFTPTKVQNADAFHLLFKKPISLRAITTFVLLSLFSFSALRLLFYDLWVYGTYYHGIIFSNCGSMHSPNRTVARNVNDFIWPCKLRIYSIVEPVDEIQWMLWARHTAFFFVSHTLWWRHEIRWNCRIFIGRFYSDVVDDDDDGMRKRKEKKEKKTRIVWLIYRSYTSIAYSFSLRFDRSCLSWICCEFIVAINVNGYILGKNYIYFSFQFFALTFTTERHEMKTHNGSIYKYRQHLFTLRFIGNPFGNYS